MLISNKLYLHTQFSKSLDPELLRSFSQFHQAEASLISSDYDYSLELNKYGKIVKKKLISLSLTNSTNNLHDGFLVYKYLSIQQLNYIQKALNRDAHLKLYLLANKLIDIGYILKTFNDILKDKSQLILLIASEDFSEQKGICYTAKELSLILEKNHGYDTILLTKTEIVENNKLQNEKSFYHNFIFTNLIKFLIAPLEQIENGLNIMKVSKFIWVKRIYELLYFSKHVVHLFLVHFPLRIVQNSYYFLKPIVNYLLLKLNIFISYKIKHFVLMSIFKSYGFFVDSYFSLKAVLMHLVYFLRHATLISLFKTYGLLVDSGHILIKFSRWMYYFLKRTLFYPIRKIYWMFEYQYKKRIKKSI